LNLAGSSCTAGGQNCINITSTPNFQTNLQNEQKKVDDTLTILRFYPIVSFGIGWKF
jgi:hypothetical protein